METYDKPARPAPDRLIRLLSSSTVLNKDVYQRRKTSVQTHAYCQ